MTGPSVPPGDQPPYASAAAVAGLACEVEALRRAVEELTGLPGRVEEVAALVARLAERAKAAPPAVPTIAGAPTWLRLPRVPAVAEDLLAELIEWMSAVYLRYHDAARALPACWLWHPDVIEELLWLRAAWHAAYTVPDAPIWQAADWHDRLRPGVVRRVRDYAGVCSVENHQPGRNRAIPATQPPLTTAVGLIADWWTYRRTDTAPAPTKEQMDEAAAVRPRSGSRGRS